MAALTLYDETVVQQVKDLAVIGLVPIQIAERLGLEGQQRYKFLQDINNPKHPLFDAWATSYKHGQQDVDKSLLAMALSGDTDALEIIYAVRGREKLDDLKAKLFDI